MCEECEKKILLGKLERDNEILTLILPSLARKIAEILYALHQKDSAVETDQVRDN